MQDDPSAQNRPDDRPVDRCVCRDVLFSELIRLHRETGATLEELRRRTGCGTGCGLCIPYIKVALRTGQSRLPVMGEEEMRQVGR